MIQLELPQTVPLPLRVDTSGVVRIGQTRVTLDLVIETYLSGCTAEEIAQRYTVLEPADIHAALAYYLSHREAVDAYLEDGRREADEWRRRIEEICPPDGFRERLLARQKNQQA